MGKFYHETDFEKLPSIQLGGLVISTGLAKGGMSTESGSAYLYAKQDAGRTYFWTRKSKIGTFNVETVNKPVLIVVVSEDFEAQFMGPKPEFDKRHPNLGTQPREIAAQTADPC
jgi:hypothetical protein